MKASTDLASDAMKRRRTPGEGSITWIAARARWQVRVPVAPGTRRTAYAVTKTEAQALLRKMVAERDRAAIPETNITVEALLTRWLAAIAPSRKPATMHGYEVYVRLYIVPRLGRYRANKLTPAHVDSFLSALARTPGKRGKKPLSPKTIAHIRTTLRTALSWAMRRDMVTRNAAALSEPPRQQSRRPPALTSDDVNRLITAAHADPWGALYVLALDTGLRHGELLGLRWDDIRLDDRTLTVTQSVSRVARQTHLLEPKTDTSRRTVGFGQTAAALLKTRRSVSLQQQVQAGKRWQRYGLVFHDGIGDPIVPTTAYGRWKRFRSAAHLPKGLRMHDLRHASASLLLSSGASLKDVSERLGHSSIAVTSDVYGHLTSESQRRTAQLMDDILKQSG